MMKKLLTAVITVTALGATGLASAQDAEFLELRRKAKAHEEERAKRGPVAEPATVKKGPSLARFLPKPIPGWRMRSNPADDADGILDLSKEISVDYVRTNRSQSASLDVNIRRRNGITDGLMGVTKLGRSAEDKGNVVSETRVRGQRATMNWDDGERRGQLYFRVGNFDVTVEGRGVTSAELTALANGVDVDGLRTL